VLAVDIKNCALNTGVEFDYTFLEAGLHNNPFKLREKLQDAIDTFSASGQYERIIIGYGICGKGAVGISARNIPLVFPGCMTVLPFFWAGIQPTGPSLKNIRAHFI
jgi:hypothetical protein